MAGQGTPNNNSELLHARSTIISSLDTDYNFKSKDLGGIELILRNTVTDHRLIPSPRQALIDDGFGFDGWNRPSAFPTGFGRKLGADLAPEETDDRIGFAVNVAGRGEFRKTDRWADANSTGRSGHG